MHCAALLKLGQEQVRFCQQAKNLTHIALRLQNKNQLSDKFLKKVQILPEPSEGVGL